MSAKDIGNMRKMLDFVKPTLCTVRLASFSMTF